MLHVRFLWYEECPSHEHGLRLLEDVLAEFGVATDVERIKIETDEQARQWRFPGSPTIRINDADIDPEGASSLPHGLTCRAYRRDDGRISPLPSREMVRKVVQAALAGSARGD